MLPPLFSGNFLGGATIITINHGPLSHKMYRFVRPECIFKSAQSARRTFVVARFNARFMTPDTLGWAKDKSRKRAYCRIDNFREATRRRWNCIRLMPCVAPCIVRDAHPGPLINPQQARLIRRSSACECASARACESAWREATMHLASANTWIYRRCWRTMCAEIGQLY